MKRYEWEQCGMRPDIKLGSYVLYSDHLAEIESLTAENQKYRTALKEIAAARSAVGHGMRYVACEALRKEGIQ